MKTRRGANADRRPRLHAGMGLAAFRRHYRWKAELIRFARSLGLPTHGYKPELCARIERRLRGLPDAPEPTRKRSSGSRDSDRPLRRSTRVVDYYSDSKTRAFFRSRIGPEFHFTYHLNQFRLARKGLTYGELVDEWLAERARRRDPRYQARIASHGKYNRFIRDFFADERNRGKSLRAAAAAWNAVKHRPGDQRYRARKRRR